MEKIHSKVAASLVKDSKGKETANDVVVGVAFSPMSGMTLGIVDPEMLTDAIMQRVDGEDAFAVAERDESPFGVMGLFISRAGFIKDGTVDVDSVIERIVSGELQKI